MLSTMEHETSSVREGRVSNSSRQPNQPLAAHGFAKALLPLPTDHRGLFSTPTSLCSVFSRCLA